MAKRLAPPARIVDLAGWAGLDGLAILTDRNGRSALTLLDLAKGTLSLLEADVTKASVSPDGGWAAMYAIRPESAARAWYVSPIGKPELARRLVPRAGWTSIDVRWRPSEASRYLDRVEVIGPDSLTPAASMLFRVFGRDQRGDEFPLKVPVTWTVSDTGIARIDSAGRLRAVAPGWVTLSASAGGWRRQARRVRVTSNQWQTVMSEGWHEPLTNRWVLFGVPTPERTTGPGGQAAFWNRGEGSYQSGAYTQKGIDALQGIGMRAGIATPISRENWQQVQLILQGRMDSVAFSQWDHQTDAPPSGIAMPALGQCGFEYPGGEGPDSAGRMLLNVGGEFGWLPAPETLRAGAWHDVWIQIFPDGTCGLALDGQALFRSRPIMELGGSFKVWLLGNSVDRKILVGPLEVWQGVRPGMDWEKVSKGSGSTSLSP